jgi:hypothetical protein
MKMAQRSLFWFTWTFIIFVSVLDGYLLVHTREVIEDFEKNPAGQFLLSISAGKVWLFLLSKFLGTVIASAVLLVMYEKRKRLGLMVAIAIATFQFRLLLHLTMG